MGNEVAQHVRPKWQPDYIGLGAMKSASTWLNQCLVEHPEVTAASKKEIHFFDSDVLFRKGVEHYKSYFPSSGDSLVGENTPSYLFDPAVPARIHSCFPSVKLVVCLRDPADRAWSHYQYAVQMQGRLSVFNSFTEAFHSDRSLADNGRYAEQLKRYLEFFEKDQIKIVFYDDLRQNPIETVQDVYRFIGVCDQSYIPAAVSKRRNQTGDRKVSIKYKRIWSTLLRARAVLHKVPGIEIFLRKVGLISIVKGSVRGSATVKNSDPASTSRATMSSVERELVVDELIDDIIELEVLTGRSLSGWKSRACGTDGLKARKQLEAVQAGAS